MQINWMGTLSQYAFLAIVVVLVGGAVNAGARLQAHRDRLCL